MKQRNLRKMTNSQKEKKKICHGAKKDKEVKKN